MRKTLNNGSWRKRSNFFKLPYWKNNLLCHNLDVINIEKNVVDSILGTYLDNSGKKGSCKCPIELKDMGTRKNLHPKDTEDSKRTKLAKACFSMKERNQFFVSF